MSPLLVMPVKFGNYEFATESIRANISPVRKLWEAQWAETEGYRSQFGYKPDETAICVQQEQGYRFYTSVRYLGEMVGHCCFMVTTNTHSGALNATDDWFFIREDHRGSGVAKKMLAYAEEALFHFGVQYIVVSAKLINNASAFFEKNGYAPVALSMIKERN